MKITWNLFRFPFTGERWQRKVLIGGALALGGILIFPLLPVTGYGMRVMRQTIRGEPPTLPEWKGWSKLFTDGICMWVVWLVYALPAWILLCCTFHPWWMVIQSLARAEVLSGVAPLGNVIMVVLLRLVYVGGVGRHIPVGEVPQRRGHDAHGGPRLAEERL
jgi:hypothetical protein